GALAGHGGILAGERKTKSSTTEDTKVHKGKLDGRGRPSSISSSQLVPCFFVLRYLLRDFALVAHHHHGQLVCDYVLRSHGLHLLGCDCVDFLNVRIEIVVAQLVQVDVLQLADEAVAAGIAKHENSAKIILDSVQLGGRRWIFLQAVDLEQNFLDRR